MPARHALYTCSYKVSESKAATGANYLRLQVSGKPSKDPKFQLGVSEAKLGSEIQEATKIPCVCNEFIGELVRGLRLHAPRLLKGLEEMDLRRSQLGLAHSYSRAKVRSRRHRCSTAY